MIVIETSTFIQKVIELVKYNFLNNLGYKREVKEIVKKKVMSLFF